MRELLRNNEVGVTERLESSPDTSSVTVCKAPFISPSALPVLEAAFGIRFDFNQGARVSLPLRADGKWRIRLKDLDTGNVIFASENAGAFVRSSKRYYVRFAIEISEIDEKSVEYPVFSHTYDARAQQVVIQFPIGTLGDTLAWFPYAARFSERHGAHVTCVLSGLIIPLLRDAYPQLTLVTPEEAEEHKLIERAYATYCLGLFFDDKDNNQQPTDFRFVGLHRTAGYILGVNPAEEAAQLVLADSSRPIPEPYVCIAVQSSAQCKYWNNPGGWNDLIRFLKNAGYRVICIDQKPIHGSGIVWNHIPHGAEDETGNRPLSERVGCIMPYSSWAYRAVCLGLLGRRARQWSSFLASRTLRTSSRHRFGSSTGIRAIPAGTTPHSALIIMISCNVHVMRAPRASLNVRALSRPNR